MKQNLLRLLIACLLIMTSASSYSQAFPPKGYDTTSYPEERKAIETMCRKRDSTRFLNGDYIGVGAEGKTYFSFDDEMQELANGKLQFKSMTPVPGTHFLRIYNGDAAIRNATVDVVFQTPEGDFSLRAIRIETYIKQNGKWYFMAGQGTRVMSDDEKREIIKKQLHSKQE